jgi:ATP-dependent protease HslVU (ClpYQ) peptidase subunit
MTTIAYRDGIIASDSRATWDDWSQSRCIKLYRAKSKVDPVKGDVIVATAGHSAASLLFLDWMEIGGEPRLHERGVDENTEFECLVVHKSGVWVADRLCRLEKLEEDFWAAGSGRQAALGAMHAGKGAMDAVRIATRIDPFSGGRVVSMSLDPPAAGKKPRVASAK